MIETIARSTQFCQRQRVVHPHNLLDTLLEVLACHQKVGIALLHRHYVARFGTISYGAFYEQINKKEFVEWLRLLLAKAITLLKSHYWTHLTQLWQFFHDVRLHDGTSWRIHDDLKEKLPGRFSRTAPAALELHTTFSLLNGQVSQVQLAADVESEHHFFPTPESGVLYIFDAGYVNQPELKKFAQIGAFYLTRGRSNQNPHVVYDHTRDRAVGKPLKEFKLKPGKDYDLQVKQKEGEYRLVLVWNPQTHCHVRFLTNVPVDYLSATALGNIYRLRWQVELYFKELKSFSGLGRMLTGSEIIIEGLVWASLLVCTLRQFLVLSAQWNHRLSTHKAARSSASFFPDFLRQWRQVGEKAFQPLFDYLRRIMTLSNPKKCDAFTPFGQGKALL